MEPFRSFAFDVLNFQSSFEFDQTMNHKFMFHISATTRRPRATVPPPTTTTRPATTTTTTTRPATRPPRPDTAPETRYRLSLSLRLRVPSELNRSVFPDPALLRQQLRGSQRGRPAVRHQRPGMP